MFRSALLVCGLLWTTLSAVGAESSPNLVFNGGFEEGSEGPSGWRFSSADMKNFEVGRTLDHAGGKVAARIISKSASMSGYWIQPVKLTPHKKYRLTLKVKLESGKALVYVHGKTINQRLYLEPAIDNPLVPAFIPVKWAAGSYVETDVWTKQSLEFDSGDDTSASINLGVYFRAGAINFDDVELHEIK